MQTHHSTDVTVKLGSEATRDSPTAPTLETILATKPRGVSREPHTGIVTITGGPYDGRRFLTDAWGRWMGLEVE